jgi:hypothetical protein
MLLFNYREINALDFQRVYHKDNWKYKYFSILREFSIIRKEIQH